MFIDFPMVSPSSQQDFLGRWTVKEPQKSNQHRIIEKRAIRPKCFRF